MEGLSAASISATSASISHRALSTAAELEDIGKRWASNDPGRLQLSSLSHMLQELSRKLEAASASITSARTVSQALRSTLSQSLQSCSQAVASMEKQVKGLQPTNSSKATDLVLLASYDEWAGLECQLFDLFQGLFRMETPEEQRSILESLPAQEILEGCETLSSNIVEFRQRQLEDNGEILPGYEAGETIVAPASNSDSTAPGSSIATPSSSASPAPPPVPKAISRGMSALSESFRAMAASLKPKPEPFLTALCQASALGDLRQIHGLLDQGANINGRDGDGNTPLISAVICGQHKAAKALLDAGALLSVRDKANKKLPPLFHAAESGNPEMTRFLLSRGADVRDKNSSGQLYFVNAALTTSPATLGILVDHGADVNSKDIYGQPILVMAMAQDKPDAFRFLLGRGADPNSKDLYGQPVIVTALHQNKADLFRLLLERGADPNAMSVYGERLLIHTVKKHDLETTRLLLDRGADPNSKDTYGVTPVLLCVLKGDTTLDTADTVALARMLLGRGADPNVRDGYGKTAMALALDHKARGLVPGLLERGADPNTVIEASTGVTLLLHRIDARDRELAAMALRLGANPNTADRKGRTPLLQALQRREFDIVRLLVERGADVNAVGMVTPLAFARAAGQREVAQMFLSRGARPDEGDDETGHAVAEPTSREDQVVLEDPRRDVGRPESPPPGYDAVPQK